MTVTTATGYQGLILTLRTSGASGSLALVTQAERDGDLFVLSLCTVLKSSFSSLLYLMPLREKCDWKGFFLITFFCIVSLKLINIPIEIVIILSNIQVLKCYRLKYEAFTDILAVGPGWSSGVPGLGHGRRGQLVSCCFQVHIHFCSLVRAA